MGSGSPLRRSKLAMVDRFLPIFFGHFFLGIPEFIHQPEIGFRLFQHIQVGPLDILNNGHFQNLFIGQVFDHDRHMAQIGRLAARRRRSPAISS